MEKTNVLARRRRLWQSKGKIPYVVAKTLREQGMLRFGIYDELATIIINTTIINPTKWPLEEKFAHRFWVWIAFLQMIGSMYLSFTWRWRAFIAGFVLMGILSNGIKKTASEFVLDRALTDPALYNSVLDAGGWFYYATVPQDIFYKEILAHPRFYGDFLWYPAQPPSTGDRKGV